MRKTEFTVLPTEKLFPWCDINEKRPLDRRVICSDTVDFSELNYISFSIRIVSTNPPAVP